MINFVPHVVLSDQAVPGLVYARNQWTGGLATFDAHAFVSTRYEIKDGKTTTDAVPVGRLAPGTIFYTGENRNGSTRL